MKVPSVGCCRCQDSEISVRSKGTSGPGSGLRQAVRAGVGQSWGSTAGCLSLAKPEGLSVSESQMLDTELQNLIYTAGSFDSI